MPSIPLPRRTALALMLAGSAWLLGACASPPPPPPVDTRAQALESLGFQTTPEGWGFSLTGKLLFDSDADQLDNPSQATADRLGRELALLQVRQVRVEGHTDDTGSAAHNQALSLRRAQAVARALAQAGMHNAQFDVQGLGHTRPVLPNDSPEHRRQNRRVSVIVPAQ